MDVSSVDIPTMLQLTDERYQAFVDDLGLFDIDHHEILRCSRTGIPIATTREQIDIVIEWLNRHRDSLHPRSDYPSRFQN